MVAIALSKESFIARGDLQTTLSSFDVSSYVGISVIKKLTFLCFLRFCVVHTTANNVDVLFI